VVASHRDGTTRTSGESPPSPAAQHGRLWEIDALRTLAIVLMVVYHAAYDVNLLTPSIGIDPYNGIWRAVQVVCGSLFLGIVGVSFWVSHARAASHGLRGLALWSAHARRGLQVLAAAALVSVATRVALGADDAVRFGILHLIGVLLLMVLPAAVRFGPWNVLLGIAVVAVGVAMDVTSDAPGALVLGFVPTENGVDWYPLLPWAGAALIGLSVGSVLYPDGHRGAVLRALPVASQRGTRFGAAGRRSLLIYLVHQPILVASIALALTVAGIDLQPS
jgi:uncharacterized membrane protein